MLLRQPKSILLWNANYILRPFSQKFVSYKQIDLSDFETSESDLTSETEISDFEAMMRKRLLSEKRDDFGLNSEGQALKHRFHSDDKNYLDTSHNFFENLDQMPRTEIAPEL